MDDDATATGPQVGRSYWTQDPIEFNGNKAYQRDDLFDPHFLDEESGMTNLELMQSGRVPIGADAFLRVK